MGGRVNRDTLPKTYRIQVSPDDPNELPFRR